MNLTNYKVELDQAILAADKTLIHLNTALKELSYAQNWGLLDIFGGGLITSFVKNDYIDSVRHKLEMAKDESKLLKEELKDIDIDFDISDFLHFSDYFFDSFVTDFLVQSKLDQGEAKIKKAIAEVEGIKSLLVKARENNLKLK